MPRPIRAVLVIAIAATLAAAASAAQAERPTVGEFLVGFLHAVDPSTPDGLTPAQARLALARLGVTISPQLDLSTELTDRDVAAVTSAAGVRFSPDTRVLPGVGQALVGAVTKTGSQLGGESSTTGGGSNEPPPGACCVGTTCTMDDPGHCPMAGGIYRGNGTSCTSDICAPDAGQCCVSRQDCRILTPGDCAGAGGIFTGRDSCNPPGTACRNPQPVTPSTP